MRPALDIFLFDSEMKLVYRGQLDDSRPRRGEYGNDIPVTGKDSRAAMDTVIAGKRPDPNQRFVVGNITEAIELAIRKIWSEHNGRRA